MWKKFPDFIEHWSEVSVRLPTLRESTTRQPHSRPVRGTSETHETLFLPFSEIGTESQILSSLRHRPLVLSMTSTFDDPYHFPVRVVCIKSSRLVLKGKQIAGEHRSSWICLPIQRSRSLISFPLEVIRLYYVKSSFTTNQK